MSSHRMDRVRNLLRQVTSQILGRVKDPRIGFVTVTDVEVSSDLRHARVFVSVMGNAEERRQALIGLESARGFVRHELHDEVTLRYIPTITFHLDESLDRGMRVNELLEEARKGSMSSSSEEIAGNEEPRVLEERGSEG